MHFLNPKSSIFLKTLVQNVVGLFHFLLKYAQATSTPGNIVSIICVKNASCHLDSLDLTDKKNASSTLKIVLKKLLRGRWTRKCYSVCLYRQAPNRNNMLRKSPADLMFSRKIRTIFSKLLLELCKNKNKIAALWIFLKKY